MQNYIEKIYQTSFAQRIGYGMYHTDTFQDIDELEIKLTIITVGIIGNLRCNPIKIRGINFFYEVK